MTFEIWDSIQWHTRWLLEFEILLNDVKDEISKSVPVRQDTEVQAQILKSPQYSDYQ